ncbi:MAG: class I SAM-dependent methyltransferase family protein [Candidatus Hermodarchaeota archaeon]
MNNENKDLTPFLKVKKETANLFLELIKKRYSDEIFIDKRIKVIHTGDYVLFPLIKSKNDLNKLIRSDLNDLSFEIVNSKGEFDPNYKSRNIEEALIGELPEHILELIPKSYDIIGKIAILEFDRFNSLNVDKALFFKKKVAKAVVKVNKTLETVYEKTSEIKGQYRLRELRLMSGKDEPETIHNENKCIFKLDVKNTYFSPRLVFERKRLSIINFAKSEVIVDMFAGVGPISIQIARSNDVKIYSIDVNPVAYQYLNENINLNKLIGKIFAYNIDVKELMRSTNKLGISLKNKVDRIIMNLPEHSIDYIDVACFLMKRTGGILHFYQFCEKPNPVEKGVEDLSNHLNKIGWKIEEVITSKIVKAYSPKADMIVIDANIKPIK